jgi:MYXO-CTERM domain-containing protein
MAEHGGTMALAGASLLTTTAVGAMVGGTLDPGSSAAVASRDLCLGITSCTSGPSGAWWLGFLLLVGLVLVVQQKRP